MRGESIAELRARTRGRKRYTQRGHKVFWVGVCTALIIAGFFGLAWSSYALPLQLHKIVIVGAGGSRTERFVEAAVARAFAREGARLFSPWNILLYPEQTITAWVASSSPRVASVALARGGDILLVAVTERKPFARWCREDADEQCVFIDEQGFVFPPAPRDSAPKTSIVFEGALTDFVRMREVLHTAERIGLSIARVSRAEGSDASFTLTDGTRVRFVLSPDTTALFLSLPETLSAANARIVNGTIIPPLEYFDVRFPDQVVFKRR